MSKSKRTVYVGAHVTPEIKDALDQMTADEGVSRSLVISRILEKAIKEKINEDQLRRRS